MSRSLLEASSLSRDFSHVRALDGVTLSAQAGEVLALLGPNGAGKTTFLRLARGLIKPSGGDIYILGEAARTAASQGGAGVAAVGDVWEPGPWIDLQTLANLQAAAGPFNRDTYLQWCQRTNLPASTRFGNLSKGQKRWVLCGLALATEPRLLLMDEPADGLDPSARLSLYQALRSYANNREAAVVVTTHILGDIEKVADSVAIVDHGKLVIDGELELLRQEVRQIARPHGEASFGFCNKSVTVLGHRTEGDVDLWWVRTPHPEALFALSVGGEIRCVGLEELYLAMTTYRFIGENK